MTNRSYASVSIDILEGSNGILWTWTNRRKGASILRFSAADYDSP